MRICVVDESAVLRSTLREFLSDLGHEVSVRKYPKELLEGLEELARPLDVVIANFPTRGRGHDGLLSEMHRWCPDSLVIAMVDHGATLSFDKAISYGVYSYLRKPISLAELELMLARLAERRGPALPRGRARPEQMILRVPASVG